MMFLSETRPVELVIDLPEELADDVEEVRRRDPDFLGRAIRYALARRIIFEELTTSGPDRRERAAF
ncbi:MAG: hypothetical protein ACRELC_09620 [Gemmatimonadota bacterium]